jgi:hypothetical protein
MFTFYGSKTAIINDCEDSLVLRVCAVRAQDLTHRKVTPCSQVREFIPFSINKINDYPSLAFILKEQ